MRRKVLRSLLFVIFLPFIFGSTSNAQTERAPRRPQEFEKTVIRISDFKFFGLAAELKGGTGFCLDPDCRFVATNYHVAALAHPRKVKGQRIIQRYLATGPEDEGATVNASEAGIWMKFALARDLAILELRNPIPHHNGIAFSLDEPEVGQPVDIYAYPAEGLNPIRSFTRFNARFARQTTTGLFAFDYDLGSGKSLHGGASGGLVIDSKTGKIIGILNAVERDGKQVALAVPSQTLADFVWRVKPYLAQSVFPSDKYISPLSADLYPKVAPPQRPDGLRSRPEESPEVQTLRKKAQMLADSMQNYSAVQTFAWGQGNKSPAAFAAYEIQLVDGYQRFREYPGGTKELKDGPLPNLSNAISTGGEWSELSRMLAAERNLKISQRPDVFFGQQRIRVFQYQADAEDGVCLFKSTLDFVLFSSSKTYTVGCYGEAWTDQDYNILRASLHLELKSRWTNIWSVATYRWIQRQDGPHLVPVTIATEANLKNKTYWCRGEFADYEVFGSRVEILAEAAGLKH